jgi:hypothetical protein
MHSGTTLTDAIRMWPTARAEDGESAGIRHSRGIADTLTAVTKQWPSPMASLGEAGNTSRSGERKDEALIGAIAKEVSANTSWQRNQYPTPTAASYGTSQNGKDHERPSNGTPSLDTWASNWATPTASEHTGAQKKTSNGPSLRAQAATWPTPAARDYKGTNSESYQTRSDSAKGEQLPNYVEHFFLPAQVISTDGQSLSPTTRTLSRRLNPAFVCWLMGWPTWWTHPVQINSERREMAWCHYRRLSRSMLSVLTSDYEVGA